MSISQKPELVALAENSSGNIWQLQQPLRFWGAQVGTRTTVIRLKQGELWLHSPGPEIPGVYHALCKLGPVKYLVAPNPLHHMFLPKAQQLFPEAVAYGGNRVQKKHPQLKLTPISHETTMAWHSEIEMLYLDGLRLHEHVFFHKSSKTLILTDLLFNMQAEDWPTRFMLYAEGVHGKLGCTRLVSQLMVKDRQRIKIVCQAILEWDFERMLMCHGEPVEHQAKQAFAQAMAWTGLSLSSAKQNNLQ